MAQQVATQQPPSHAKVLQTALSDRAEEIKKALPGHISVDKFVRTAQTAIALTRNIEKADAKSLLIACSKAAADGLILDGREAALVVDYKGEVQYRIMVAGKKKLLWNTGLVKGIIITEVRENDEFEYVLGDEERIVHNVNLRKDRGTVFAHYAIVTFKDGAVVRAVMTLQQIEAIRDRSDAWKAYKLKKIKSTPWQTDPVEMGNKTVFHRLSKNLPRSVDMEKFHRAVERDEEDFAFEPEEPAANASGEQERRPTKKRGGAAAALKDVTPKAEEAEADEGDDQGEVVDHDPETGEVIEDEDREVGDDI